MIIMDSILESIKKHWVEILLITFAAFCYGFFIFTEPLVDYDEATYAKVITDTIESGDISTFTYNGRDWFEKPPLYLWLAMGSVKVFGEREFAFRIPSVLASLVCLWLVYLITRELTGSTTLAVCAFFVLLFTPPFFVFAREARLDSGVIMTMLGALYFCIRGWREEKYLLWILPAVAVGFLFKSVIALLILPIIGIYSLFYKKWTWLKSKYLWWGLGIALVIFVPWHLLQTIRFGQTFWDQYLLHQVFARGVSTLTGTNNYYDYVSILWLYYRPWLLVIGTALLVICGTNFPQVVEEYPQKKKMPAPIVWHEMLAPLISAIFIIFLFTVAQTHLSTYIMPAFPFLSILVALLFHRVSQIFTAAKTVFLITLCILLVFGGYKCVDALNALTTPLHHEEKALGVALKEASVPSTIPFYSLDWPHAEAINYYAGTRPASLSIVEISGKEITGPFYLITHALVQTYLVSRQGVPYPGYEGFRVVYQGDSLVLFYADKTIKMPVFSHQ